MTIIRFLLCACVLAALLPTGLSAQARVDSVSITITNVNPRVGDYSTAHAVARGAGGLPVQNQRCTLDPVTGPALVVQADGSMRAIQPGPQVITARCGTQTATATVTVRPRLVRLSLTRVGTGAGSLFANPFESYAYDEGAVVEITATPLAGSQFVGFTGCTPVQVTPQSGRCRVTMAGNQTVTGAFSLVQQANQQNPAQNPNQNQPPRAKGPNPAGAVALIALVGVAAYGTGVYLKSASLGKGGGGGQCYSTRACTISAFSGACSCAGTVNGPCDYSGTPGGVGANCMSGVPCRAGLSCNQGRCEDRNGRCPF